MSQKVYVLDKNKNPLMPTTRFGHVRVLLKQNKAVEIIISMEKKLPQIDIKQNARQQIVLKNSEQSTLNKIFQNKLLNISPCNIKICTEQCRVLCSWI